MVLAQSFVAPDWASASPGAEFLRAGVFILRTSKGACSSCNSTVAAPLEQILLHLVVCAHFPQQRSGSMDRTEKQARARAEMMFKHKEEQAKDLPIALADYQAAQQRTIENMLRLRKLRLMRKAS